MARILVVDDDSNVRTFVRLVLEEVGHEVTEAGDGAAALRAFRRQPSDLVLCDLCMPVKDGLETIQELRRDFSRVKVLAISGDTLWANLHVLHFDRELGVNRFLPKPFDREELLDAVAQVLCGRGRGTAHVG